ncbi:DUF1631 family protein [Dechloromonas sp. A34]|uniref:DUF1631 family protein n=1 Tax=Dechloromonas sp. A34 TaxID=447588 RepID=UPI002248E3A6|nr:DUF1631 family protein [Dechloromonas sp. A34]
MPAQTDSFEILRDCRALFLKQLGTLLQDSGVLASAAIQAVQHGAGTYFDEMAASQRRGSFKEEASGLTSSRITLVGEEDLELNIRLDQLSTRFFEATAGSLWKLNLRLTTLLRRPDLSRSNNPIDPKGICRGLDEMFASAGAVSHDKKLDLLGRLESSLLQNLPALYNTLNDFLEQAGIEAAQAAIVSTPETARKPAAESPTVPDNLLLTLQKTLRERLPIPSPAVVDRTASGTLLSQAALERLLFRLNELDRPGNLASSFDPVASHSLETLIPGLFSEPAPSQPSLPSQPKSLSSLELGIPANAPEGLAVDTLASLFAAIFDDPELPDALKAVISRLQITILKTVIRDAGFFSDASHPARQLLDRIGVAMLGLHPDTTLKHPLCTRLLTLAAELQGRFKGDVAVFTEACTQIDALIAERHAGITDAAEPYIPLLHQLDRRDQALAEARRVIAKAIPPGTPVPIREFFNNSWSKVLQVVWMEHGPDSNQWATNSNVMANLLWTFEPKPSAEKRNELNKRLPEILSLLKAGMDRLGMAESAQAAFFDICFTLQTEALRSTPPQTENPESPLLEPGTWSPKAGNLVIGEILSGKLVLRTLEFAGNPPAPARKLPCSRGDWLRFELDHGKACVALVCHVSPTSQRTLLSNPDSGLAMAIHPAVLDRQLREGKAEILSSRSLFDTAAERVLRRTAGN